MHLKKHGFTSGEWTKNMRKAFLLENFKIIIAEY